MNDVYKPLFTPFKIGEVEIKNRFVMCPMTGSSIINKNQFNYAAEKFYLERAKNGVGLIITAPSMILDMWGRGYWLNEATEAFNKPLKEFFEKIHKYDTKIFMQLGVGLGRVLHVHPAKPIEGSNIDNVKTAASELPNVWDDSIIHRPLTVQEIHTLRDNTIEAAKMAKQAGADGVEIHAVHEGYLLDQFAIENMNNRQDEYGGSLENRMRLACEIIRGIKAECGKDFPVTVRYSVVSKMKGFNSGALPGEDFEEFGRDYEESQRVAKMLEEAGCDGLNADNGTYDSWYWAHPPMYMKKACNLEDVAYIRQYVDIPVICAGRMEDHKVSADAIKSGRIDAVGIARQFLADEEWISKLEAGKEKEIRPCIACHNGCLGSLLQGYGLSCALNPAVMHEDEYHITKAENPKKVMVIGGGIGGMETARVCAMRGHTVDLYEKSDRLAGVFNAAAAPEFKEADKDLIKWYEKQMQLTGVRLHMNTEVAKEFVESELPDAIVVASGATARQLKFAGAKADQVISAIDYLSGSKEIGDDIIVVGGGLTGCEIAYDIARNGKKVTLVEMAEKILTAKLLCAANSSMLKDLMEYHDVDIMTSSIIEKVEGNSAIVKQGEAYTKVKVDSIIVSAGYIPNNRLYDELKDLENVYLVGDADHVGSLLDVIKGAYKAALDI